MERVDEFYATGNHTVASSDVGNLLNQVADIVGPTLMSVVFRRKRWILMSHLPLFEWFFSTFNKSYASNIYLCEPVPSAAGPVITATAGTGGLISPGGA